MNIQEFYSWERSSRETIDFKVIYADVAGDLLAGLLLSQIVYWFMPDRQGRSKVKVQREGKRWMAKKHGDWFKEIRLTEDQARRSLKLLKEAGIVEVKCFKFAGAPTTHISLNELMLMKLIKEQHAKENDSDLGHSPDGSGSQPISIRATAQMDLGHSPDPYTETTNRDYKQRLLKEEEMIDSSSPPENTEATQPDKSGMCDEVKKSGEKFWKGYKRVDGKGSKKEFLAKWAKLSEKKRVHAQELHDKLCLYMPEWRNGEKGCPWPENFLKPKYMENEIDFDALQAKSGKAQQTRSAPGAVETAQNSPATLNYTNGQWQKSEGRERPVESEATRMGRELVAKAMRGEI